jgi:regulator of sigma E protease
LGARALVIAAGPLTNFLFAIVAFAALVLITGRDVTPVGELSPRIDRLVPGDPADKAGLKAGDVVRAIDGAPVASYGDLQKKVSVRAGDTLLVSVQRGGQQMDVSVVAGSRVLTDQTGVETKIGYLGVKRDMLPSERKIERLNPVEALGFGAEQTWGIIQSTGLYLYNVVTGHASSKHIAGTLGILDQSGKVAEDAWSSGGDIGEKAANLALSLIGWSAVLSVAVGIVNLLPVPILDGGHLLFYAIEGVRGRPLSARAQDVGYKAGLAVIACLFVFATWNDLQRFKLLELLGAMLS